MDDTQMLDWLQSHMIALRLHDEDAFLGPTYCLEWIDNEATPHKTKGRDLRDCVRGSVVGETVSAACAASELTVKLGNRLAKLKELGAGDEQCVDCMTMGEFPDMAECNKCIADTPAFTELVGRIMERTK